MEECSNDKNISLVSSSHSFSVQTNCKADVGASYCLGQDKNWLLRFNYSGLFAVLSNPDTNGCKFWFCCFA